MFAVGNHLLEHLAIHVRQRQRIVGLIVAEAMRRTRKEERGEALQWFARKGSKQAQAWKRKKSYIKIYPQCNAGNEKSK